MMMALWKSPLALGIHISVPTLPPPPDSPKMVTLLGSPPNLAILSRTHSKACTASSIPTLPEYLYFLETVERSRNPRMFNRWLMLTTTTSFLARHMPGSHSEVPESNPPPCNQNMTGLRVVGLLIVGDGMSVVHTLSTQQFSDICSSVIGRLVCCMVIGPQWSHLRTPLHFFTGCGGINRSTFAYGMPR